MVRNIGLHRSARKMAHTIGKEDLAMYATSAIIQMCSLESYAKGVNDFVDSMTWYPIEFYLMWAPRFEPWTAQDSLTIQVLMQYFISFDWFLELTRQRLTEIYDKELVDRMLPFKQEDYYFNNTQRKHAQ